MQTQNAQQVNKYKPLSDKEKIIVIGSGPAGVRFINEVLKRQPQAHITVFNNEPFQPYNRVQLSALLAGDVQYESVFLDLPDEGQHTNFTHLITKIESVNKNEKFVVDASGEKHSYDKLVFATGSRAHIPNIKGSDSKGVYTFRNLKDTESLYARVSSAKHIVVAGGGLLGIEAARALLRDGTKVSLVQQGSHIMNRQLDEVAAALLTQKIEDLGIRVITNTGLDEVHVNQRVTAVTTRKKEKIDCDTVLLCAGITPNIELARESGITIGKGIKVNDRLETSANDIFAIGECCEHDGQTYGLANPGYEQAAVAADVICGGESTYKGSVPISRLKVMNETVCSMGEVTDLPDRPLQREIVYKNNKNKIYRKLVLLKGHLIGAVGIGDWPEARRIEEAYRQNRSLLPWQLWYFKLTGNLWFEGKANKVSEWPATSMLCQCNNISQGECVNAIESGCTSLEAVSKQTTAGTVCGSCKPLLEQLIEDSGLALGPRIKEKGWLPIILASIIATLFATAIAFMPAISVSETVQSPSLLENIWNNKFWKQVTGFSLLGMSVVGLLMSLRKRIKNKNLSKKLGEFAYWRLLHIVLGVFCAATLILHTGMHLGKNLNQMLMINFLLVLAVGSLAGAVIALSHKLKASASKKLREFWTWVHIVVTWPLPILLGFHILTVYYY